MPRPAAAAAEAEKIVVAEAQAFRGRLQAEAWCRPSWHCVNASTKFAGKNWTPYRRTRAVYPGAGSVTSRNHSTGHTEDCQLPSP